MIGGIGLRVLNIYLFDELRLYNMYKGDIL